MVLFWEHGLSCALELCSCTTHNKSLSSLFNLTDSDVAAHTCFRRDGVPKLGLARVDVVDTVQVHVLL